MAGLEDFYATQSCPPRVMGGPGGPIVQSARQRLSRPSSSASYDQNKFPPGRDIGAGAGTNTEQYAELALGLTGLFVEHIASHPFIVLRRQCQVNNMSYRCHRTPFTFLPILVQLNRTQGISVLWKGIGSTLTVRGGTKFNGQLYCRK